MFGFEIESKPILSLLVMMSCAQGKQTLIS